MGSVREVPVASWREFRSLIDSGQFRSWAFRGQADSRWPLLSSLSRHLKYAGVNRSAWVEQERRIVRIFQRKAHLFLKHIPAQNDAFEWLALMQHHGSPTRLLDATWSPYVALYFALERAAPEAAVWAFDTSLMIARGTQRLRSGETVELDGINTWEPGIYETRFLDNGGPFVIVGEPRIMNQRLIAQSGTFLAPGRLDLTVDAMLAEYEAPREVLIKILLDTANVRKEAMAALYNMNVTAATLFPDLDGLARSMAYELESHWAFDPTSMVAFPGFPTPEELGYRMEAHESARAERTRN